MKPRRSTATSAARSKQLGAEGAWRTPRSRRPAPSACWVQRFARVRCWQPLLWSPIDRSTWAIACRQGEILAVLYVPEKEEEVLKKKALVLQMEAEFDQAKEILETARPA